MSEIKANVCKAFYKREGSSPLLHLVNAGTYGGFPAELLEKQGKSLSCGGTSLGRSACFYTVLGTR